MMLFLEIAFFLAGVFLTWALIIRPVLRSHHFLDSYFQLEQGFWSSVRTYRTMAIAKLGMLGSVLVAIYDFLVPLATTSGIDWTPLTAKIPSWGWPVLMFSIFAIFAWLRKVTHTTTGQTAPIIGPEEDR